MSRNLSAASAPRAHPRALAWTPWGFAAAGLAIGLLDLGLLAWLDVRMTYAGADVRAPVVLLFAGTFASLGYAVGHLRDARARALRDQQVIAQQLVALRAEQARALENEALASVGRMAASVAHEVRNPLGVIRASASVLSEELRGGQPDALQSCAFIRDEVERLDAFIGKLLGYARANTLDPADCDVRALVERVLALTDGGRVPARAEVRARHATLDADVLVSVLVNLLQNAQQAAVERVELCAVPDSGALVLEVRDDGPGVDPAHVGQLFVPFFTTKATGTGLGLAMAQKLVVAHGGLLEYRAGAGLGQDGEGACFRVVLRGVGAR